MSHSLFYLVDVGASSIQPGAKRMPQIVNAKLGSADAMLLRSSVRQTSGRLRGTKRKGPENVTPCGGTRPRSGSAETSITIFTCTGV